MGRADSAAMLKTEDMVGEGFSNELPSELMDMTHGGPRGVQRYAALGWSGTVPDACRDGLLAVPIDVAPWLWGWPHRFVARMQNAGTEVILLGPLGDSGFSAGIDTPDLLAQVPIGLTPFAC